MSSVFNMHANSALILAVIPPTIYLGLCFKLESNTQITVAGFMSIVYAFLMFMVTLSIVGKLCGSRCAETYLDFVKSF